LQFDGAKKNFERCAQAAPARKKKWLFIGFSFLPQFFLL